VKYGPELK